MPQLTKAAVYQGELAKLLRWPYHAKVMNTLAATSNRTVCKGKGIADKFMATPSVVNGAKPQAMR
jgi:hypothetical protein